MKKIISVLLAVLMLMSMLAVSGFATELIVRDDTSYRPVNVCKCEDHVGAPKKSCHCCIFCENLDMQYVTTCAKNPDGTLKLYTDENGSKYIAVCCANCTGLWPCKCGCECCAENENIGDKDHTLDDVVSDEKKEEYVDGFQKVLKVISDAFDEFFNKIFEFLRIFDIIGKDDI